MIIIDYHIAMFLLVGAEMGGWLFAYVRQPHPPRNRLIPWRVLFSSVNIIALLAVLTFYFPVLRDPAMVIAAMLFLATNPWFLTNIGYEESVRQTTKGQMYTVMLWVCFGISAASSLSIMVQHRFEMELLVIGVSVLASLLITQPAGILHQYQEFLMGAQHARKRLNRPTHRRIARHH